MARRDRQVAVEAGPRFVAWLWGRRPGPQGRTTMGRDEDHPLGNQ